MFQLNFYTVFLRKKIYFIFKEILNSGRLKLMNKAQQSAFYQQIVKEYGKPEDWPELVLQEGIELVQSLSVEDLEVIKQKAKASLVAALKKAQTVEWSQSQVRKVEFSK